jgi:hypothetical protein
MNKETIKNLQDLYKIHRNTKNLKEAWVNCSDRYLHFHTEEAGKECKEHKELNLTNEVYNALVYLEISLSNIFNKYFLNIKTEDKE